MYRAKIEGPGARSRIFDPRPPRRSAVAPAIACESRPARRPAHRSSSGLRYQPIVALDDPCKVVGFEALVRWQRTPHATSLPPARLHRHRRRDRPHRVPSAPGSCARRCSHDGAHGTRDSRAKSRSRMQRRTCRRASFHQPDLRRAGPRGRSGTAAPSARSAVRLEITEGRHLPGSRPHRRDPPDACAPPASASASTTSAPAIHRSATCTSLPIDTLKIDRSFINALSQNNECRDMVRTILDLARNLKVEVIAEGPKPRRNRRTPGNGLSIRAGLPVSPCPSTKLLSRRCFAPPRKQFLHIDGIKQIARLAIQRTIDYMSDSEVSADELIGFAPWQSPGAC